MRHRIFAAADKKEFLRRGTLSLLHHHQVPAHQRPLSSSSRSRLLECGIRIAERWIGRSAGDGKQVRAKRAKITSRSEPDWPDCSIHPALVVEAQMLLQPSGFSTLAFLLSWGRGRFRCAWRVLRFVRGFETRERDPLTTLLAAALE
jgi:hypothetical protein